MEDRPKVIDKVFSALADGNRRKIIELLHEKDATLSELAEYFPFSAQALSKHIKILESARILSKQSKGKFRIITLNRDPLKASLEWISYYSRFWNESFDKLEEMIDQENEGGESE